ncbi:unnamed protein product [Hydatigera taeniaeformis]|uniref:Uncharacterized protein n=1 Tax=Hydatigena taeniaeformis TaxID=6205 RepID=A0A0R3WXL9_HYDTA|nr:unnamed protein product [Hydatigera taeniaeformis]
MTELSLVSYPHKCADSHRPTAELSLTSPLPRLLEDPCLRNALPLKTLVYNWPQQHHCMCVGVCVSVCMYVRAISSTNQMEGYSNDTRYRFDAIFGDTLAHAFLDQSDAGQVGGGRERRGGEFWRLMEFLQ